MISPGDFARYANDPSAFRRDLIVDVDGTPRRFGDVMADFQRDDFAAVDPGFMACNGRSKEPAKMRAMIERPRGGSKTSDLAALAVWTMAFANRPVKGYAFAADRDQSALLAAAVETLLRLNPWVAEIIAVQRNLIVNQAPGHPGQGSRLEIFPSDVASSYGILPDFIIADELCHWQGDGSLFHSILSSAAKRAHCMLVIITNAGFMSTWQWDVREHARTSDDWIFRRLEGPAPWHSEIRLQEQKKLLPLAAWLRLFHSIWSSGLGDALDAEAIEEAFKPNLQPMSCREPGWVFVAGVDLGLTRDCSAVVVLAVPDKRFGRIRLASHKLYRPSEGKKVDLFSVQNHILELDERFGLEACGFDPWNCEMLAAAVEADSGRRRRNQRRRFWTSPFMREIQPTASNLRSQAALVIESFQDGRLEFYDCLPLRRDFQKLRCEEKSYGIRLVSPRDEHGHGDSYSAFANALLIGHELNLKRPTAATAVMLDGSTSPANDPNAIPRWAMEFERQKQLHEIEQKARREFEKAGGESALRERKAMHEIFRDFGAFGRMS